MTIIRRDNWKKTKTEDGGVKIYVICPKCKSMDALDHEVHPSGVITPSLDCPQCPFHENGVRLEGWTDES